MTAFWVKISAILIGILVIGVGVALLLGSTRQSAILAFGRLPTPWSNTPHIYLLDVDTGVTLQMTRNPYSHRYPVWSPDGSQLAFIREFSTSFMLGFIDLDTLQERDVPRFTFSNATSVIWSPDSTQVAFNASLPRGNDMLVVDVNDLTWRRLTETRAIEFDITWSPDGQTITFTNYRVIEQNDVEGETFRVDVHSGAIQSLGVGADTIRQPTVEEFWSPDGTRYVSVTGLTVRRIALFTSDGEGHLLFESVAPLHNFQWSPDGRYVAYMSEPHTVSQNITLSRLYVLDVATGNIHDMGTISDTVYSWRP